MKLFHPSILLLLAVVFITSADPSSRNRLLQPANDDCEAAQFLDVTGDYLATTGSTVGGTVDSIACLGDYRTAVFYQFVATGARYQISTCHPETTFNTSVYVDDAATCSDFGCTQYQSEGDGECLGETVEFFSEKDTTYTIAVAGVTAEDTGDFGLSIQEFVRPANDECASVEPLQPTYDLEPAVIGSTANATPLILSCEAVELIGVYYQFVGTGARFRVSTCDPATDFSAAIVVGDSPCPDMGCTSLYEVEKDDNCEGFGTTTEFRSEEGVNYTIAVRGATFNSTGSFGLILHEYLRPSNDVCSQATPIELDDDKVVIAGSTLNSTISYFSCLAEPYPTVFYTVVGTGETFYASTCGSETLDFNSSILVNEGTCDPDPSGCTSIYSDADMECDESGNAATVEWETEVGAVYTIAVKGVAATDKGNFELQVQAGGNFTTGSGSHSWGKVGQWVAPSVLLVAGAILY